jgi:hypothetical protein
MGKPLFYVVFTLVRLIAHFYLLISDIRMNVTDLSLPVFLNCSNNDYG